MQGKHWSEAIYTERVEVVRCRVLVSYQLGFAVTNVWAVSGLEYTDLFQGRRLAVTDWFRPHGWLLAHHFFVSSIFPRHRLCIQIFSSQSMCAALNVGRDEREGWANMGNHVPPACGCRHSMYDRRSAKA